MGWGPINPLVSEVNENPVTRVSRKSILRGVFGRRLDESRFLGAGPVPGSSSAATRSRQPAGAEPSWGGWR